MPKLVGVFIPRFNLASGLYAPFATQVPYLDVPTLLKSESKTKKKVNKNIKLFVRACEKAGVKFEVHKDKGFHYNYWQNLTLPILLIIDRKVSFYAFEESPSGFLKICWRIALSGVDCTAKIYGNQQRFLGVR